MSPAGLDGAVAREDRKLPDEATGGTVIAVVVVRLELTRMVVVVSTLEIPPVMSSGSETVKRPLAAVVKLDVVDDLPPDPICGSDGVWNDVAPPTMVVVVLIKVVIRPPGRVDVSVTGDAVVTLDRKDVGGAPLSIFVEIKITVVICPPGKMFVAVVSRLEVRADIKLDGVAEDTVLSGVVGVLLNIVDPSGKAVVGMVELLKAEGRAELNREVSRGELISAVDVLIKIVGCPPGKVLVITTTALDAVAGKPLVEAPGSEVVLVTALGAPTGIVGGSGIFMDDGDKDAIEVGVMPVIKTVESELSSRVVVMTGDGNGREGCAAGLLVTGADTGGS